MTFTPGEKIFLVPGCGQYGLEYGKLYTVRECEPDETDRYAIVHLVETQHLLVHGREPGYFARRFVAMPDCALLARLVYREAPVPVPCEEGSGTDSYPQERKLRKVSVRS
jgi:hypothetical protein